MASAPTTRAPAKRSVAAALWAAVAAGIVIAVPSMVAYSWLAGKANSVITRLEGQANELVRIVRSAP